MRGGDKSRAAAAHFAQQYGATFGAVALQRLQAQGRTLADITPTELAECAAEIFAEKVDWEALARKRAPQ